MLNFELYSKLLWWTIWMWWFQYNTFFCISRRATCIFPRYSFPRIERKSGSLAVQYIDGRYRLPLCLKYKGGSYIITPFAIHHFQTTSYHGTASKRLRESFNPNSIHVRKQIHLMFHIGFCWILDTKTSKYNVELINNSILSKQFNPRKKYKVYLCDWMKSQYRVWSLMCLTFYKIEICLRKGWKKK